MDDYQRVTTTHKTPHPSVGFIYIIPLGITLGFIFFTVGFFVIKQNTQLPTIASFFGEGKVTPTDAVGITPEPANTPTPIPYSELPKEELAITVLNGSGISGVAGKAATILKNAGFTNVKTGNADTYDFRNVTIRHTKEAESSISSLQEALEKQYTISEVEETVLKNGDVEIIIGKASDTGDDSDDEKETEEE